MNFLSILAALLLEQARPLGQGGAVHSSALGWMRWTTRQFDTGHGRHALAAWGVAVLLPALLAVAGHHLLMAWIGWPAALAFDIAVLYATLGFRQFSHHFSVVRDAVEAGDWSRGASLLAQWQQTRSGELSPTDLVRLLIEYSVLAAHRHVFGVLAWFTVLAVIGLGPAGAVIYRLAEFASRYWSQPHRGSPVSDGLRACAQSAWARVDWLPARLTALGFAVVGSFEDAVDGWRRQAQQQPRDQDGLILAAASGALGVQLGGQRRRPLSPDATQALHGDDTLMGPALPGGREAQPAHLRAVVGLVWRSVVLWLLVLALLAIARWTA